jgi:hypothetical protein
MRIESCRGIVPEPRNHVSSAGESADLLADAFGMTVVTRPSSVIEDGDTTASRH